MLSQHPGLPTVVESVEELGAKHGAQRMPGKQETRLCWHPTCSLIGQGTAWYRSVHVEMGLEHLIPGVQEQEATKLTAQVVVAKLEKPLAGGLKQESEKRAFIAEDEWVEGMR